MSTLTFKVLPATTDDATDLGAIVYLANQPTKWAEILHKPPVTQEEQVEFYASRFRERIAAKPEKSKSTNLAMEVMKAVMVDGDGKEIIMGVASWLVPTSGGEVEEQVGGDEKAGEKETGEVEGEEKKDSNGDEDLPNWPAGIGAARFMRDSSLEADVFKEKFTGKSGAELVSLAVHPDHQRKGVGALLVNWGLAKADAAGVRAFVQSTVEGRRLYQKCGFKAVAEIKNDMGSCGVTGVIETTCMVREVCGADIGPLFS